MLGGRPRQKIRAPRRRFGASEEIAFDDVWSELVPCFRQIHLNEASQLSYEELFRKSYNIVLKKKGEQFYNAILNFEEKWLSTSVQAKVLSNLSPELTVPRFMEASTAGFSLLDRKNACERFLYSLRSEWVDQLLCLNMISDVTSHLERNWCDVEKRSNVYTAGIQLFRENVLKAPSLKPTNSKSDSNSNSNSNTDTENSQFNTVLSVLINTMLDLIQMERDGEIITRTLLHGCTQLLESIYISRVETDDQKLYQQCFQPSFLNSSKEFYSNESDRLIQENDISMYCRKAKDRLMEEQNRCVHSLSTITIRSIEEVVREELISKKLKDIISMESGVISMIINDRLDDLALVYELSSKVDIENVQLMTALHDGILSFGESINNSALQPILLEENSSSTTLANTNHQISIAFRWVEDVLRLKDKYDDIVAKAFSKDPKLHTTQIKAFTLFINSTNFNRAPEYVSLFIDDNMKKGIKDKTDDEVEDLLQKAIHLLKFITDKDLFERYYKRHLSRRLLMNKSQSMDVERQMIGKMRIELGNSFTSKMEVMFKDMVISAELTSSFKNHLLNVADGVVVVDDDDNDDNNKALKRHNTELSVNVLTSMTWPQELVKDALENNSQNLVNYPMQIKKIIEKFNRFYGTKHNGRKLVWMPRMGTADIRARFPLSPNNRIYELNVSTFAMIILLLFNNLASGEKLSFKEIQAQTNIPLEDLKRNLQSLSLPAKTRILKKEPLTKEVNDNDKFSFNEGFKSQYLKIKVGVIASANRVESEREKLDTEKKNDDARKLVCEASIVRIMKQRKELEHSNLVAETISQLTNFKPDVSIIKNRIESLIEREYLERILDGSVYRYLA